MRVLIAQQGVLSALSKSLLAPWAGTRLCKRCCSCCPPFVLFCVPFQSQACAGWLTQRVTVRSVGGSSRPSALQCVLPRSPAVIAARSYAAAQKFRKLEKCWFWWRLVDSSEQSGSFLLLDSPLNSHSGPQGLPA